MGQRLAAVVVAGVAVVTAGKAAVIAGLTAGKTAMIIARLAAVVATGETAVVAGLTAVVIAGAAVVAAGQAMKIFLLLDYFLNSTANIGQFHNGTVGGKDHPRGYQKRRQHRYRADFLFHLAPLVSGFPENLYDIVA